MPANVYDKLEIPEEHRLTSIGKEEGEFIYGLLKKSGARNTLETGFAYGSSAAHILSATQGENGMHIAIDPFQSGYQNLGIKNIERLGFFQRLRFINEPSQLALPKLVEKGIKLDFAFIDGGHKFEEILVDWYYIDKLLNKGGFVAFHDAWLPATKKVADFIKKNRADYKEFRFEEKEKYLAEKMFIFQKVRSDRRRWFNFENFA